MKINMPYFPIVWLFMSFLTSVFDKELLRHQLLMVLMFFFHQRVAVIMNFNDMSLIDCLLWEMLNIRHHIKTPLQLKRSNSSLPVAFREAL